MDCIDVAKVTSPTYTLGFASVPFYVSIPVAVHMVVFDGCEP